MKAYYNCPFSIMAASEIIATWRDAFFNGLLLPWRLQILLMSGIDNVILKAHFKHMHLGHIECLSASYRMSASHVMNNKKEKELK